MTFTDALAQAISECQRFHYDYTELQRLLADQPDVPWETRKELEHSRFGLCRDFSIWTCQRTWELCPDAQVEIVMGMYTGGQQPIGHAWVEVIENDGFYWADPTFDVGPKGEPYFDDRTPWESWRWDGKAFVEPMRFERRSEDASR